MATLRAGIIGCGGRGGAHALGYSQCEGVEIVACADLHEPAARRLASHFDGVTVYGDYRGMLADEDLDIVSMCLWPELHCEAVLACVEAGSPPRLINAEKPMAPTYGEAVAMHEACRHAGIMLTFSHQRRFGPSFRKGRELIAAGAVGDLQRLEMNCSNLFDWGTHWFDMMEFYNDDLDADWVMGQIACVADQLVFGTRVETAGLAYVKWPNDVTGLLTTGQGTAAPTQIRAIGSGGIIDVDSGRVRLLSEGRPWQEVPVESHSLRGGDTTLHIIDSIACLREGRESILCSRNALRATELIFATYESSRRRSRVVLPLKTEDSALLTMVASGELTVPDWPAFLTDEEEDDGFELLFNGRDVSGWHVRPASSWSVKGGILRGGHELPGRLVTEESWADLTLAFEFRLGSRAEAALVLRCDERGDGITVVLKEDRWDPRTDTSTGALKGVVAPAKDAGIGASRWNWAEVTLRGTALEVVINDADVLTCDLADVLGDDIPACGTLALAAEHGTIDVRNLLVRAED